jgi:hypothetical protein
MKIDVVDDWLEATHPHQTPKWARAARRSGEELVCLRIVDGRSGVVLPLLVTIDGGVARSPDPDGGPMAWGRPRNAFRAAREWLRCEGITGSARACPTAGPMPLEFLGQIVDQGPQFVLPLRSDCRLPRSIRRGADAARKAGYWVAWGKFDEKGCAVLDSIVATMEYPRSRPSFDWLLDVPAILFEVKLGDDVVGASLVSYYGNVVSFDAGGSLPEHRENSPLKLADKVAIEMSMPRYGWACFGGPANEGVAQYKRSLGCMEVADVVVRW